MAPCFLMLPKEKCICKSLSCSSHTPLVMYCTNECAFADPCHLGNLPIGLPLFQEGQSQINLLRRELFRSAVFEIGVLSGNRLSCLCSFHNHAPFILGKRKHDSQNQITCKRVFNKSHVQNMKHGIYRHTKTGKLQSVPLKGKD